MKKEGKGKEREVRGRERKEYSVKRPRI
jgi:hypothetical protein